MSQQLGNQPKKPEELEVLQEDDEFEEFEDGSISFSPLRYILARPDAATARYSDWDAKEEDREDDKLWEDDWDDDAVEDQFTRQLRCV